MPRTAGKKNTRPMRTLDKYVAPVEYNKECQRCLESGAHDGSHTAITDTVGGGKVAMTLESTVISILRSGSFVNLSQLTAMVNTEVRPVLYGTSEVKSVVLALERDGLVQREKEDGITRFRWCQPNAGNMSVYTVQPGRVIAKHGVAYFRITREACTAVDADMITHTICKLLNESEKP